MRHFGTLAQKNRLVFVEALFQHTHPQNFCGVLHSVYYDGVDPSAEVSVISIYLPTGKVLSEFGICLRILWFTHGVIT